MTTKIKYKIDFYDITPETGYVSGLAEGVVVNSENCNNLWNAVGQYSSLPAVDGTDPITAPDLSAYFNKKNYTNVEDAKSAIITSELATAISTHCSSINYSLSSGSLVLECYHADNSLKTSIANVMASDSFKNRGALYSTPSE